LSPTAAEVSDWVKVTPDEQASARAVVRGAVACAMAATDVPSAKAPTAPRARTRRVLRFLWW